MNGLRLGSVIQNSFSCVRNSACTENTFTWDMLLLDDFIIMILTCEDIFGVCVRNSACTESILTWDVLLLDDFIIRIFTCDDF